MIELKHLLLRSEHAASLTKIAITPDDLARLALIMFLWALCFPLITAGLVAAPPLGLASIVLAAVGVAVGNVLLKRLTGKVDLLMATGWQFILGSAPLFLVSQIFEAPVAVDWSPAFIGILLALSLLGTALAFALWFSVLHRGEVTRLNTFTFLTPGLALIIGIAFFSESLRLAELGGIALIMASVWWVRRSWCRVPCRAALPQAEVLPAVDRMQLRVQPPI